MFDHCTVYSSCDIFSSLLVGLGLLLLFLEKFQCKIVGITLTRKTKPSLNITINRYLVPSIFREKKEKTVSEYVIDGASLPQNDDNKKVCYYSNQNYNLVLSSIFEPCTHFFPY